MFLGRAFSLRIVTIFIYVGLCIDISDAYCTQTCSRALVTFWSISNIISFYIAKNVTQEAGGAGMYIRKYKYDISVWMIWTTTCISLKERMSWDRGSLMNLHIDQSQVHFLVSKILVTRSSMTVVIINQFCKRLVPIHSVSMWYWRGTVMTYGLWHIDEYKFGL